MGHGHHIEIKQEQYIFSPKTKRFTIILMVLGLVLAGIGIANLNNDSSAIGMFNIPLNTAHINI